MKRRVSTHLDALIGSDMNVAVFVRRETTVANQPPEQQTIIGTSTATTGVFCARGPVKGTGQRVHGQRRETPVNSL